MMNVTYLNLLNKMKPLRGFGSVDAWVSIDMDALRAKNVNLLNARGSIDMDALWAKNRNLINEWFSNNNVLRAKCDLKQKKIEYRCVINEKKKKPFFIFKKNIQHNYLQIARMAISIGNPIPNEYKRPLSQIASMASISIENKITNEYKTPLSRIASMASISIERTIKNEYKYAVGVSYP